MKRFTLLTISVLLALVSACTPEDCTPNTSLEGKWRQVETPGQPLLNTEVEFKNNEGLITSVSSNPYRFVIGDVVWKNAVPETNGIFDVQVLTRSTAGTASYGAWKIAILPGGKSLAFTRPGNATDVYQRWERID